MKKVILCLLTVLTVIFGLTACGEISLPDEEVSMYDLIITEDGSSDADSASAESSSAETTAASVTAEESSAAETTAKKPAVSTTAAPESSQGEYVEYWFRTKDLRDRHYEKHGIEMGFASADEYRKAASDVVNDPAALHKTEKEDGDDVYYIEETNEFVVVSKDGYLRTYFNPARGKDYFDKQ